jgi:hypothetical protein
MKNNVLSALSASNAADMEHLVGMVEIKEELLTQVGGGLMASSGYICTISGECNGGTSCWPQLSPSVE